MSKDGKAKEPIRLRQRVTPSGKVSLYLDIYEKGRRKYEYLNLYLLPGSSREVKNANKETLSFAKMILAKRLVEFKNGKYGFVTDNPEVPFIGYIENLLEAADSSVNSNNLRNTLYHVRLYAASPDITFSDITPHWVRGFRVYLDSLTSRVGRPLGSATKQCYLSTLKACIRKAVKDGILSKDPTAGVDGYRSDESRRMYLTIDEVRKLSETPCSNDAVRRAFLFSCLTGLRSSDIKGLTWGNVQAQGGFTRIIFQQQKTRHQEYLDITDQAVQLMGDRGADNEKVFADLIAHNSVNHVLEGWCRAAGINKHITFHCARHTFATMMLELGTNIYVVSKLLGHTNLSTTQIYTKVVDKNKQEAVASIPKIIE